VSGSGDSCRGCGFKVDPLHRLAQVIATADQVAKVFAGDFSLSLELGRLLLLVLELLDVSLETDADIVCRTLEGTTDLRADAKCVLVCVVDGCKLLRELCAESVGQRLWH